MLHLYIISLALVVILVDGGVLNIESTFTENNSICREFNETLYKYVDIILKRKDISNNRMKRSENKTEDEFYNFSVRFNNEADAINIRIQIPRNTTFPYESMGTPFFFFLPLYTMEVVEFEEFPEKFLVREGRRCRYNCSGDPMKCVPLNCWESQFVCFGDIDKCLEHDGDGSCVKSLDLVAPRNKDDILSVDFGNNFKIGKNNIEIKKNGQIFKHTDATYFWKCLLENKSDVVCSVSSAISAASYDSLNKIFG